MAIYINPQVFGHINELRTAAQGYNSAVQDAFNDINELSTSMDWVGPDNDILLSAMTSDRPRLQQLGNVLMDIANDVEGGVSATYETQNKVARAASEITDTYNG